MKISKILPLVALAFVVASCNKPAGELVGASKPMNFKEANPYGMLFIKKGSFMMGANTQSAVFEQADNVVMVTVDAFWMDETEITNNEYRQFVNWVRDSIALTNLVAAGMTDYAIQPRMKTSTRITSVSTGVRKCLGRAKRRISWTHCLRCTIRTVVSIPTICTTAIPG